MRIRAIVECRASTSSSSGAAADRRRTCWRSTRSPSRAPLSRCPVPVISAVGHESRRHDRRLRRRRARPDAVGGGRDGRRRRRTTSAPHRSAHAAVARGRTADLQRRRARRACPDQPPRARRLAGASRDAWPPHRRADAPAARGATRRLRGASATIAALRLRLEARDLRRRLAAIADGWRRPTARLRGAAGARGIARTSRLRVARRTARKPEPAGRARRAATLSAGTRSARQSSARRHRRPGDRVHVTLDGELELRVRQFSRTRAEPWPAGVDSARRSEIPFQQYVTWIPQSRTSNPRSPSSRRS